MSTPVDPNPKNTPLFGWNGRLGRIVGRGLDWWYPRQRWWWVAILLVLAATTAYDLGRTITRAEVSARWLSAPSAEATAWGVCAKST